SPVINIVGEHATYHIQHDAPLTSDIEGVAAPFSHWVHTGESAQTIGEDGARAIAASRKLPGQIATLILPADTAWLEGGPIAATPPIPAPPAVSDERIAAAAELLNA